MNNEINYVSPFKKLCITIGNLPTAYLESMSYYEGLTYLVNYLSNNVIPALNNNGEVVEDLINYVNNYFNNLDVQEEINNKLDEMAEDGTLTNLIKNYIDPIYEAYEQEIDDKLDGQDEEITEFKSTVNDDINSFKTTVNNQIETIDTKIDSATSGSPLAATSTAEMTETDRIYVNTTDGHWYWYDGDNWQDGGVYQSTSIADNSIYPKNIYKNNVTEFVVGNYTNTGALDTTKVNWRSSGLIEANAGDVVIMTKARYQWLTIFDSNQDLLEAHSGSAGYNAYVLPTDTAYIGFSIFIDNFDTCKIYINGNEYPIYNKYNINWLDYINNSISPEKLIQNKISDFNEGIYNQYGNVASNSNWLYSPLIEAAEDDVITITSAYQQYLTIFDNTLSLIEIKTNNSVQVETYTLPADTAYIGINIYKDYADTCKIYINNIEYPIYKMYNLPWLSISDDNYWYNKKGAIFGDSIVEGYYDVPQYAGYAARIKQNLKFEEFTNYGQSGKPITNGTSAGNGINTKIRQTSLTDFDLIVIAGGTNDFKLNAPMGSLGVIGDENFDTDTFYGALRDSIEYILAQNINARICLWTPLQRDKDGYDVNTTNSAGCKLIDYVNAIKEVGNMYAIPVCDMYSNSGVTEATLTNYTVDGLHLNKKGYDFTSNYYTNFIKNI